MKELTIVMPFLNEGRQPLDTLDSIYATAPSALFRVIVVDDASDAAPLDFSPYSDVYAIRHEHRTGVDASRHEAICHADTPYILILDAHMRFQNDQWMERLLAYLHQVESARTIFCTECVSLGYGIDRIEDAISKYRGAGLHLIAPYNSNTRDGEPRVCTDVLEGKWLTSLQWKNEPFEISCVMGANYAFHKQWYMHLRGLQGLQKWGTSEPYLSLKSWLAGGDCKCLPDITIAHYFRDRTPFSTESWNLIYNKFLLMSVLLPREVSMKLMAAMPQNEEFHAAYARISAMSDWVAAERRYFDSIRVRDIYWFMERFGITLDEKVT